jgi:hypothetical protein
MFQAVDQAKQAAKEFEHRKTREIKMLRYWSVLVVCIAVWVRLFQDYEFTANVDWAPVTAGTHSERLQARVIEALKTTDKFPEW